MEKESKIGIRTKVKKIKEMENVSVENKKLGVEV